MKYTIKNITNFLNSKFPLSRGEEWDHNGLILGSLKSPLSSVLISLDLTPEVLKRAIANNISMIITHHPFLFEESLAIEFKKNPYKKEMVNQLQDTGIAYFSLHTPYDVAPNGMTKAVTSIMNIKENNYSIINKYGILIENHNFTVLGSLVKLLKTSFDIDTLEFFGQNHRMEINKIGILPGSGDIESIIKLHKSGADIIITSDVKWSELITIKQQKIPLLIISHYMENVFVLHLYNLLKDNFSDLDIKTIDIKYLITKV